MDVSRYQGIHQFGRNYAFMLESDTRALDSVDRVLAENMVRFCAETVEFLYIGYSPPLATYQKGSRLSWSVSRPMPEPTTGLTKTG